MPALPDDIFAASREAAISTWTDAGIAARYPSARDGSAQPSDGYFDSLGDAQAVINARAALIGVERRRFGVLSHHVLWPSVSASLPQVQLSDGEQGANGVFLAARIQIDLEAETSSYELFG